MTSIYDLSWSEISFLAKLQLFFKSRKQEKKERMCSVDPKIQAEGYSALSSTYYSIIGTAFAQLKMAFRPKWLAPFKVVAWCFSWSPLAVFCYWRMLPLSDKVVELIGYEGMTPEQCDVRQSILRRRRRYEEAEFCIRTALAKNPEKAHTRGLLYIGLAEIYRHERDSLSADREMRRAFLEAAGAEEQDPRQAARIYRRSAEIAFYLGEVELGNELRRKAEELAEAALAADQRLKLFSFLALP